MYILFNAFVFKDPSTIPGNHTSLFPGFDYIAGIMNFFGQSGSFVMGVIFGKIVDFTHSFESPQFVMVGVLIVCGLCWMTIDASKKIRLMPVAPLSSLPLPQVEKG
jgi:hypothetical protein